VLLWTYHLHFESQFASGLLLKKLDKKLERTLLHSYRKVILFSFGSIFGTCVESDNGSQKVILE
jgi:hypothetical protein